MSFDKNYPKRKDRRNQYRGKKGKAVDPSCRSHGNCPACKGAREVKEQRKIPADLEEQLQMLSIVRRAFGKVFGV